MIALLMLAEAAAMPMPAFLSGCWEQTRGNGGWTEECWTNMRGGMMVGSSRNGRDDAVVNWEWMRIERAKGDSLMYYASPNGAPPVGFKATEANATSITFINASHDYPQRIRYTLTDGRLDAEISLVDGSNAEIWSYRRTAGATPK